MEQKASSGIRLKRIQTDNGKEFNGYVQEYLSKNKLIHYWNYPAKPESRWTYITV
jgi:hypothetical protein